MDEFVQRINILIFYADEDKPHAVKIRDHLSTLKRQHGVYIWDNGEIRPGTEWEKEIAAHLNTADIVVLLVSSDFMASPLYNVGVEALERYEKENIYVIPCIVRWVDVEGDPLSMLQMLPAEAKPVSSWQDRDEAYKDIALELRRVVRCISSQRLIKKDEQVSLLASPDLKKTVNTVVPERFVNSSSSIYNGETLIEGEIGGESPTLIEGEIGGESPRSTSFLQRLLRTVVPNTPPGFVGAKTIVPNTPPGSYSGRMQPAQSGGRMQPALPEIPEFSKGDASSTSIILNSIEDTPNLVEQTHLKADPSNVSQSFAHLTHREREVVTLLERGQNNNEIAHSLSISPKTVQRYITSISRKLGITDRTQFIQTPYEEHLSISRDPGMQPELLPHNPAEEEHLHFKKQIEKQIKDTTSGALIIYGEEKLLLHPIYLISHFRWQFAPQAEKRDLETLGNEAFQYFLGTALYKGTPLAPVAGRPGRPAELQAGIEVFKRYKTPSGYICAAIFHHLPQDDYLVWMTPNNPISIGVFADTVTMIDLGQTNRRIS